LHIYYFDIILISNIDEKILCSKFFF
jgi:hypothetical protein